MRCWTRTWLGALLGAVAAGGAWEVAGGEARNSPDVRLEEYEVSGASARELRRDLDRKGPLFEGRRYDARTRWWVRWRYDLVPEAGGCRVARPRVELEVAMTLPRWRRPWSAPDELVERWERYLEALRGHEDGHARVGADAARAIDALLRELPSEKSCPAAERAANRAAQAEIERANGHDRRYDRETDHGATQGARFP